MTAVAISTLNEEQKFLIQQTVWDLRVNNVGYRDIPKLILNKYNVIVSVNWCHQAARAELTIQETESRAHFREYELERLDKLGSAAQHVLIAAWHGTEVIPGEMRMIDPKIVLEAIKVLRSISESRRKLLGIDADLAVAAASAREQTKAERDLEVMIADIRKYNDETKRKAQDHAA